MTRPWKKSPCGEFGIREMTDAEWIEELELRVAALETLVARVENLEFNAAHPNP